MKKLSKLAFILFMLVTAVFAVTACSGSVEEIKIDRKSEPQTVYVVGTELNRDKGAIIASGEYESVPFNDPNVQITGYDKNTIGKQVLTITYMGASTTLNIEVVPRLQAVGFDYFVGETVQAGKAKVKINKDDGSSTIVNSDDPDLTFGEGSDKPFTAPGTAKISVSYKNAEMEEPYTGDIDVNVYQVANGDGKGVLHRPSKIAYESHELAVNTSGGYLTLESANKELTRTIQVTPEMVSGFRPSVATIDNMQTPAPQELTIQYAGYTFTYDIEIKFSDVSLIKLRAKELGEKISWAQGVPEVSETDGQLARTMIDTFMGLNEERMAYIAQDEYLCLARLTAIYERAKWEEELGKYHFTVKNNTVVPSFESLAEAEEDYKQLTIYDEINPENELYKLAQDLTPILLTFYNFRFYNGQTIGSYLTNICPASELQKLTLYIPVMQEMYNALANDFEPTKETDGQYGSEYLKGHQTQIEAAVNAIYSASNKGLYNGSVPSDREYFKTVDKWYDGMFLRSIYQYYLDRSEDQDLEASDRNTALRQVTSLATFALPGDLEDYFVAFINANSIWGQISSDYTKLLLNQKVENPMSDNTFFYYYYDQAYEIVDKIEKENDALTVRIYKSMGLGSYLLMMKVDQTNEKQRVAYRGYVNLHDAYYKDEQSDALWAHYLTLVENTINDPDYAAKSDFAKEVEELYSQFMAMTPIRQMSFLISLDGFYFNGMPEHLMDFSSINVYFVKLLADHYGDVLPANAFTTFHTFMLAVEDYARHTDAEEFNDMFRENMEETIKLYEALQGAEKDAFDQYVGEYYQLYKQIYDGIGFGGYGEYQGKIDELKDMIDKTLFVGNVMMNLFQQSQSGMPMEISPMALYPALAASFERANKILNEIFETAPDEVKNKINHEEVTLNGFENPCTLDYAFYNARSAYMTFLSMELDENTHSLLMDLYFNLNIDDFLVDGFTAIFNQFCSLTQQDEKCVECVDEEIYAALETYFSYSMEQIEMKQSYLTMFDGMELFANGVKTYYQDKGMRELATVARKVFDVEAAYILWHMDPDGSPEEGGLPYKESFLAKLKDLTSEVEKLTGDEKTDFDAHFNTIYQFYCEKEQEVNNYKAPQGE